MCSYFGALHPDLEPLPSLGKQVGAKPSENTSDLVFALLLHPDEDLCVAQPVLVLVQLDNVHDGLTSGLIVFGLGNSGSSDDVIPSLEVGVCQFVGAEQMKIRTKIRKDKAENELTIQRGRFQFQQGHRCTGTGA